MVESKPELSRKSCQLDVISLLKIYGYGWTALPDRADNDSESSNPEMKENKQ